MQHCIILLRHGAASFDAFNDHLRPLITAGRQEVQRTSGHLRPWLHKGTTRILASDALRTRQTAEVLAGECDIPESDILTDPELYGATPGLWLKKIPAAVTPGNTETLVCVGHNPTMSQLLNVLTGTTDHMRTASAAVIDTWWDGADVVLPARLVDYFTADGS